MKYSSLYDLFNLELSKMKVNDKYKNISNFISDDKACLNFIKEIIDDMVYDDSSIHKLSQDRAKHIVITFLLGQVLKNFGGLYDEFSGVIDFSDPILNQKMWMYVSLYHDYGYFSEYIYKADLSYDSIVKYRLFTDYYEFDELKSLNNFSLKYPKALCYTYDEILNYDKYARFYHCSQNSEEKIDHGILGSILIFDRLIKKKLKNNLLNNWDFALLKSICLTISQHDIFKSDGKDSDLKYLEYDLKRLTSDSNLKISRQTPLLLFLSLVDTIECVKRFSKSGNNNERYLIVKTVLKGIKISINKNYISIDLTELKDKTESKNLKYDEYVKAILDLEKWTEFEIDNIDNIISVKLKSKGSNAVLFNNEINHKMIS